MIGTAVRALEKLSQHLDPLLLPCIGQRLFSDIAVSCVEYVWYLESC